MSKKRGYKNVRGKKDCRHYSPLFYVDYSQQQTVYEPKYRSAAKKRYGFVLPAFEEACSSMELNLPLNSSKGG